MDVTLDTLVKLKEHKNKIWIRQVIVPGINDNLDYIEKLKEYLKQFDNIEKIELLPYHTMGVDKYKKLRIKYRLDSVPDMDIDKCKKLEESLNDFNL